MSDEPNEFERARIRKETDRLTSEALQAMTKFAEKYNSDLAFIIIAVGEGGFNSAVDDRITPEMLIHIVNLFKQRQGN